MILLLSFNFAYGKTVYISVSGNDASTGTSIEAPWKSLSKISSLVAGDQALLKRGDVFYGSFVINASIFIGAYGNGPLPIVTLLVTLPNWSSTSTAGIYSTTDSRFPNNIINIVVVDNKQYGIGRYPNLSATNKGYITLTSSTSSTIKHLYDTINWKGGELIHRSSRWTIDRLPITNQSGSTITFTKPSDVYETYPPKNGYGYFIQSHIKTLDQFGEWYYDKANRRFYMYFGDKLPANHVVQVATGNNLVTSSSKNAYTIDGIAFYGANQDAIDINTGVNITISNCTVMYAGADGINGNNVDNFNLLTSRLINCNNSGIQINGDNPIIKGNYVYNTYHIAGMGKSGNGHGRAIGTSGGITEDNVLINSGYVGIQIGGGNGTIIRRNIIDSFDFIKDDGAAIYDFNGYTPYEQKLGRQIVNNIISNGIGAKEGTNSSTQSSKGIYLDDYANNYLIAYNTVINCQYGLFFHSAYKNVVRNNVFYNNNAQIYIQNNSIAGIARNNTITDNIFFSTMRVPSGTIVGQHLFNAYSQ
jgi:parallel beta-helix repeat protein